MLRPMVVFRPLGRGQMLDLDGVLGEPARARMAAVRGLRTEDLTDREDLDRAGTCYALWLHDRTYGNSFRAPWDLVSVVPESFAKGRVLAWVIASFQRPTDFEAHTLVVRARTRDLVPLDDIRTATDVYQAMAAQAGTPVGPGLIGLRRLELRRRRWGLDGRRKLYAMYQRSNELRRRLLLTISRRVSPGGAPSMDRNGFWRWWGIVGERVPDRIREHNRRLRAEAEAHGIVLPECMRSRRMRKRIPF